VITSQKAIISLIITVILFIAFAFFSFAGLFDLIEARFYNPSINTHMVSENNHNAKLIDDLFTAIQSRFAETLETDEVRRSLVPDQDYNDFFTFSAILSPIKDAFDGIQWIRLIISEGRKLHFSTHIPDIINYTYQIPFYRNYNELDLPYDLIAVESGGAPKYTFDNKFGRILFSLPLYDSFDIYRGTAILSLSMDSILNKLLNEGRMIPGRAIMLIPNPQGIVFGILAADETLMPDQISSIWEAGGPKTARFSSADSGVNYILISTKTSQDLFVGNLVKEETYLFPTNMKVILLLAFFLTMYLTIFLLLSLEQEPVAIIQSRMKQLQISILEQFYELKGNGDWDRWIREMENRREEISGLLKQGIRPVSGDLKEKIDTLINKSWDELLSLLGSRREPGFDEEKLRSAINSMLAALPKTGKDLFAGGEGASIKAKTEAEKVKTGLLKRASAIVEELEEADLVEELEEAELQEVEPEPPKVDIAALASQIEFSPEPEQETNEDDSDSIEHDLEIVSPFSAMLDGFADTVADDSEQEVETIEDMGGQLITKPFGAIGEDKTETLEVLPDEQEPEGRGTVIKEEDGLPFISVEALNQDEEKDFINPDFKNLVDSVIKV